MLTIDLSPLYRSTIGFDRLAEALETAGRLVGAGDTYPPYDIQKTGEDSYRITMAVAGFTQDDLKVEVQESTLLVVGQRHAKGDDDKVTYLHHGIAGRAFERRFQLADYVKVIGASLADGLLSIELKRELPEELKPRRIEIATRALPDKSKPASKLIEGDAAKAA
ncbi:MAG: Hsp20 family protein [Alphaproteobacteria bacterium]